PYFSHVTLTEYQENGRAVPVSQLQSLCERVRAESPSQYEKTEINYDDDPTSAWQKAWQGASADELICVTGSFFIAAELRPLMLAETSQTRT
ncbi:MAG: hypothetical protein RID07_02510, partial [Lacipirellulaceae bacterium]